MSAGEVQPEPLEGEQGRKGGVTDFGAFVILALLVFCFRLSTRIKVK